jgi:hypothetical protein
MVGCVSRIEKKVFPYYDTIFLSSISPEPSTAAPQSYFVRYLTDAGGF